MRDMNMYYKKALEMCKEVGAVPDFPITKITNLRSNAKAWGKCIRSTRYGQTQYEIRISLWLLDETKGNDEGLLNTMIHEILHACAWKDKHGGKWLSYAEAIRRKYGINVKRTSSSEEKGLYDEAVEQRRMQSIAQRKIKIVCTRCGLENLYARECKVTKHLSNYCCSACRGALRREDL